MFIRMLLSTHLLLKDSQQKGERSLGAATVVESKLSEICSCRLISFRELICVTKPTKVNVPEIFHFKTTQVCGVIIFVFLSGRTTPFNNKITECWQCKKQYVWTPDSDLIPLYNVGVVLWIFQPQIDGPGPEKRVSFVKKGACILRNEA